MWYDVAPFQCIKIVNLQECNAIFYFVFTILITIIYDTVIWTFRYACMNSSIHPLIIHQLIIHPLIIHPLIHSSCSLTDFQEHALVYTFMHEL